MNDVFEPFEGAKKYDEKRFEITLDKLNGVNTNDEYFVANIY